VKLEFLFAMSVIVIAVAGLTACEGQPTPTVPAPTPWDQEPKPRHALGAPFDLRPGQSAEIDDAHLLVHLSEVRDDSRCPADVVCVRAGDVTVVLQLATQQAGSATVELKFESAPLTTTHGGYRVTITAVQPYPFAAGTPIPASEYVVSLVVEKAA
jgi:hypothetical protein